MRAIDEDGPVPQLQRDVQRLLGRCMLRIQQYEQLLKTMLADHELAGTLDNLEARRAKRARKLSTLSLGMLAKEMFKTYVVPVGFERDLLPERSTPMDKVSMAFSYRMSMSRERLSETKTAIEDLVALRNQLVHHLIQHFDLWTEEGCIAASRHLDQCYERIDRHFDELSLWAKSMVKAREISAQFMGSPEFLEVLRKGTASK